MLEAFCDLQIEVREVSVDPSVEVDVADNQHFMFKVFRVVKRIMPAESEDPDVRLAQALLARSRNAGAQEKLWIANSIQQLKQQGQLASLSHGGHAKGLQRFRKVAEHVGHVAQVVAQLNKLKLRLNDEVRLPQTGLAPSHRAYSESQHVVLCALVSQPVSSRCLLCIVGDQHLSRAG